MPQGYEGQNRDNALQRRDDAPLATGQGDAVMPHDLAAERSVLAAMLLSQDVLNECISTVHSEDF